MNTFNKISSSFSTIFAMLLGSMVRLSDNNKNLTQYIVAMNQKKTPEDIINEASLCLKNILSHKLFAFAIKNNNGTIDVWLDPGRYRKSLESIIMKDFITEDKAKITYMNVSFQYKETEEKFNLDDLISYDLKEESCHAKIYLLPGYSMLKYHDDMINIILKSTVVSLSRQMDIDRLTQAAAIDPLTGCYNRREFEIQLTRNAASARRHKNNLSLFMLDLDHFKTINDTYGHQTGDEVLKVITNLACENMRKEDIFARYGGEEFVAILPETGKQKASAMASRLRKKIAEKTIETQQGSINITASFGVASLTHLDDISKSIQDNEISQLVHDLDTRLYKAKTNGRNRVYDA